MENNNEKRVVHDLHVLRLFLCTFALFFGEAYEALTYLTSFRPPLKNHLCVFPQLTFFYFSFLLINLLSCLF